MRPGKHQTCSECAVSTCQPPIFQQGVLNLIDGHIRWVKVVWAAPVETAPVDKDTLKANWGYQGTMAKAIDSQSLTSQWHLLRALTAHLSKVLSASKTTV